MLTILTACHGRPEVFKLFLNSLPQDAYLICVGDDDQNRISFEESKIKGTYIIHPNKPVSKKWNYGLQHAKKLNFEYLVITGSDDIFSTDLWDHYKTLTVQYFGLLDFYFLDYATSKIKYQGGFMANRQGEPHGAGRALHRSVLDAVNWKLWDDTLNEGLDASMTKSLSNLILSTEFIKVQSKGWVAMDIKTKDNIHKANEYQGRWIDDDEKIFVLNKVGWI